MIKIGLADNIPTIHYGIKHYFEGNSKIKVSSYALNYEVLTNILLTNNIDVLILDLELADFNVITDLKWIINTFPKTNVLIYSNLNEQLFALNCIKSGAKGYIKKSATLKEIEIAVKEIYNGGMVVSDKIKMDLSNKKKRDINSIKRLSARESEVLRHLCSGKKNNEISSVLNINEKTTSTYKSRLYKKLDVSNLVDLVAKCKSMGII